MSPVFPALVLQPLPNDGGWTEGTRHRGVWQPLPPGSQGAHPKPARRPLSHSPALHQETTGACLPAGWLAENDNELEMRSLESSEQDPKRFSTHVRNHLVQQML